MDYKQKPLKNIKVIREGDYFIYQGTKEDLEELIRRANLIKQEYQEQEDESN